MGFKVTFEELVVIVTAAFAVGLMAGLLLQLCFATERKRHET